MLSFLKRKETSPAASAVDEAASVQAARTRARRRLIGAAVLVGVGIIGFPLLFETQPRPIAVDIPIEIPSRVGTPSLGLPAPKPGARPVPKPSAPVVAERAAEAPIEPAPSPPAAALPSASSVAGPPVAASAPPRVERATATVAAASAPASRVVVPATAVVGDAQRAQALLDGKPATPSAASAPGAAASEAKGGRFVVQAGAYTDATALREARQKVERLGMKTYTQVIETEAGARTRVRVGPFATRDEADKAAARIKGSGLAASILSL